MCRKAAKSRRRLRHGRSKKPLERTGEGVSKAVIDELRLGPSDVACREGPEPTKWSGTTQPEYFVDFGIGHRRQINQKAANPPRDRFYVSGSSWVFRQRK